MNTRRCGAVILALTGGLAGGCQTAGTHGRPTAETQTQTGTLFPRVNVETSLGDITLELNAEKAPVTALNFLRYVEERFYDGTIFHRVAEGCLIQGGAYLPSVDMKTEGVGEPVFLETDSGLSNVRGAVAIVHGLGPHSATTQFFINTTDNADRLDYPQPRGHGYIVFGKVVEGMETVDKIAAVPLGTHPKYAAGRLGVVPVTPVVIKSMRLTGPFDRDGARAIAEPREADFAWRLEQSRKTDKELLEEFVERLETETNARFTTTDSGLMVLDHRLGDGPTPTVDDTVTIRYRGMLLDGRVFESSLDNETPPRYEIKGLIAGLQEALTTMNVGGKRTIIVPPELGFGAGGVPQRIPPRATIVYEIELLELN